MSITSLLQKGREGRGGLERFADGCNAMARHYILNCRVRLLKSGGHYSVVMNDEMNRITQSLAGGIVDFASYAVKNVPVVGFFAALVNLVACGIIFIPVTLAMGVGLAAKKIALARDEESKEYHKVTSLFIDCLYKEKKVKELENEAWRLDRLKQTYNVSASFYDLSMKQVKEVYGVESKEWKKYEAQLKKATKLENKYKTRHETMQKKIETNKEELAAIKSKLAQLNFQGL